VADREWFGHVNVHSSRESVTRLIREVPARPAAVGVCEANGLEGTRWPGFDAPFVGGLEHTSPRSGDTMVLRRTRGVEHLGVDSLLLSPASEPDKVAGLPRFSSTIKIHCALGRITFTEIHNHWAGPAADDADADRIAKTHTGMVNLGLSLDLWEMQGFTNIVVGDFNVPRSARTRGWLDPWEMLSRRGMEIHDRHLDGVAVGEGLKVERLRWIPAEELDTDHPGVIFQVGPQ
jgi:hypothetical protein